MTLSKVQNELKYLSDVACNIYQNNEDYYFFGINKVGIKPVQLEEIAIEHKQMLFEKDSIYSNFIKTYIDNNNISELQKKYLFEACECGNNHNILAAAVMLGVSAELLLIDLCNAYKSYLDNHCDKNSIDSFDKKVIKARSAYHRLEEFYKRAELNVDVFKQLGFENIKLNFSSLDIIRETRNDSGHPTGNTISEEQFKIYLGNYQAFLSKALNAIKKLPTM